jgi:hypothetical protein
MGWVVHIVKEARGTSEPAARDSHGPKVAEGDRVVSLIGGHPRCPREALFDLREQHRG